VHAGPPKGSKQQHFPRRRRARGRTDGGAATHAGGGPLTLVVNTVPNGRTDGRTFFAENGKFVVSPTSSSSEAIASA